MTHFFLEFTTYLFYIVMVILSFYFVNLTPNLYKM